ncbi:tripartite tricarboxylate transporter TctB family protein [Salinarimonas chemoclinalis]|uniref:tripartite tricarboxylate transporter TctB family protein n=1 Tax=Salinarimonas chemoclinalis TaxID=3241599 RepID=UPI0035577F85
MEISVAATALAFAVAASALPDGRPGRLGPADVPLALAALTGLAALVGVVTRRTAEPAAALEVDPCAALDPVPMRTVVRLLASLVLLATTIGPLGLLVSGTLCGALAASAVTGARLPGALAAGVAATALVAGVFVGLVGQPLPLLPGALR